MSSVKQRTDGSWRSRFDWIDDDGQRREVTKITRTKTLGQAWIDEQKIARSKGTFADPRTRATTLADFYAEWSGRQLWAGSTREAYAVAMNGCTFAALPLARLRPSHGEAWVKTLSTTLAASTVRTRVGNVRTVLRAAVRDGLIAADPTVGVRLPRQRRAEHAMTIPTSEQVGAMLEASEDWFRPFLLLGAFAGLRIGEICGVQVDDIDFLRRTIYVQRQVQKVTGGIEVIPPKHGSERIVYVPDELTTELARHIETVGTHGGFLLPGNPPNPDSMRTRWNTLADGFTPHDLRHYFASGLIAAGCPVTTVQRALGHAKPDTTLRVYSHLWPTAEDTTRAASGAMLRAALGDSAADLRQRAPGTL